MTNNNIKIALIGNPNSGKTTLFNSLTGSNQRVGNWPGVTVEKKEGSFKYNNCKIDVIDLPGIYSLNAISEDEKVARKFIMEGNFDLIINLVDATNMQRNLFLTTQLIEFSIPVIVALNMIDLANKQNFEIDHNHLSKHLGFEVFPISAISLKDIEALKQRIIAGDYKSVKQKITYPNEIEDLIEKWTPLLTGAVNKLDGRAAAISIISNDRYIIDIVTGNNIIAVDEIIKQKQNIKSILNEDSDIVIADSKFGYINGIMREVLRRKKTKHNITHAIDKVVLNSFAGIPIFFLAIYLVFWLTINFGSAFIDFFELTTTALLVDGTRRTLLLINTPEWIILIISGGIGTGITTVMTFVPLIFVMFFSLSVLEDSGYMARAAFVMDKFMRVMGLPGKAFVPLIVGFGCTVPAILATRTMENKRDRLLTMFVSPMMSCGARLPVYALFATAFFREISGFIVFSIYIVGIIFAILTGILLKRTLFIGDSSHFVMELPPYHLPRLKHILIHTWIKLKGFILKAGLIIVISAGFLGILNSISTDGKIGSSQPKRSILSAAGKSIIFIFEPMGVSKDNWPAAVSLFTGIFAKESIIGTLNSLYGQLEHEDSIDNIETTPDQTFIEKIVSAFLSVPVNLAQLKDTIIDPLGMNTIKKTENDTSSNDIFAMMRFHFNNSRASAYAYILFILLYFPCIAAMGTIIKEGGIKFGLFVSGYLTLLAWIVSVLFYQIAAGHSIIYLTTAIALIVSVILLFTIAGKSDIFKIKNEDNQ